jgi:hypothetical protein
VTRKKQSQNAVQTPDALEAAVVSTTAPPAPAGDDRRLADIRLGIDVAMTVLVTLNTMYNEAVDVGRLDAAELLFTAAWERSSTGRGFETIDCTAIIAQVRSIVTDVRVTKRSRVRAASLLLKWS